MAYTPDHSMAERNDLIAALIDSDARALDVELAQTPHRHLIAERFSEMVARVDAPGAKTLRVLLIGDCLHLDITGFLVDEVARTNVSVQPTYLTDKNPAGVIAGIRRMGREPFDAVFYSPFTYENGLVMSQLASVEKKAGRLQSRQHPLGRRHRRGGRSFVTPTASRSCAS